jgi:hypothetical protein
MEENKFNYRRSVTFFYTLGLALNLWFLYAVIKENGGEVNFMETIKKPFKNFLEEKTVVIEAEEILRSSNNG